VQNQYVAALRDAYFVRSRDAAMLAWDRAVRGEHGGAHNPTGTNQHTKEVKPDNILLDQKARKKAAVDYGTSTDAGLRRLDKAAARGDAKAADMLAPGVLQHPAAGLAPGSLFRRQRGEARGQSAAACADLGRRHHLETRVR
jgi:hypothetical protein